MTVSVASGLADHRTQKKMTNENIMAQGGITQTYTAVAIMRLVEEGQIGLHDTIDTHVNELLMANFGATIEEIWGSPRINDVTIH